MRNVISIGLVLSRALFMALCLSIGLYAIAKPERPDPTPKAPKGIPRIDGPCNWGEIQQDWRKVQIFKHEKCYVEDGQIQADGKLLVHWVECETGRIAPGLYTINDDGSITGKWSFDAVKDATGKWVNMNLGDVLRDAKKVKVDQ